MGESSLSLLFQLKGDASSAKRATAETKVAVKQLRTEFGTSFPQMQRVAASALSQVTQSLTNAGSRLPLFGDLVNGLGNSLSDLTDESAGASTGLAGIGGAAGLAVVGLAALSAGAVVLAKHIFDLAKEAADFEGSFLILASKSEWP